MKSRFFWGAAKQVLRGALVATALAGGLAWAQPNPAQVAGTIGVNKYDLFAQYTGTASGGNGSPAYRRVTVAMARKSLADARDAGIRYMRVSMSGRTSDDSDGDGDSLELWRKDPQSFWRQVDQMMDDLDAHGIQLIPVLAWGSGKFPRMTNETLGDMFRNPQSRSWQLMERWATEFVTRYRGRRTVLFYELTNELNNYADLDLVRRCKRRDKSCQEGDRFTTADLVAYTGRLAALVRRLDPSRQVSSGFTIPRASAEHLRARPEWVTGRPDWTRDSREEFARNLRDIHVHTDIISIHLYGGRPNRRFGSSDPVDLLAEAKRAADRIGKPLFVGEFGDREAAAAANRDSDGGSDREMTNGSHAVRMIRKIRELRIPYSAIWVWQLYQNRTYSTHDNKHSSFSLEPGYTDEIIELLRQANGLGPRPSGRDTQPPRVVLTWPLPCASLRGQTELHAVASDDRGRVSKVEFLLNGTVVATDTEVPYRAALPQGAASAGKHRLVARAHDASGNVSEFVSDVLVGRGGECAIQP